MKIDQVDSQIFVRLYEKKFNFWRLFHTLVRIRADAALSYISATVES